MNHEVKATAHKKKDMGKKGKVRRMILEKADNGVISTAEHERSDEPGMYMGTHDVKTLHPSASHLKKHVASMMFGDTNDKEAAEDDKGGSPD